MERPFTYHIIHFALIEIHFHWKSISFSLNAKMGDSSKSIDNLQTVKGMPANFGSSHNGKNACRQILGNVPKVLV